MCACMHCSDHSPLPALSVVLCTQVYLKLFLWGNDRNLEDLIRKALSGHRTRNRKTAIMFTTALAFMYVTFPLSLPPPPFTD
jgi:hypothetical protein